MLLAALIQAKYQKDNRVVEIAEGQLMAPEHLQSFSDFYPNINFDGYFNRDSLEYAKIYGIPQVPTVIRGTLRYEVNTLYFDYRNMNLSLYFQSSIILFR